MSFETFPFQTIQIKDEPEDGDDIAEVPLLEDASDEQVGLQNSCFIIGKLMFFP